MIKLIFCLKIYFKCLNWKFIKLYDRNRNASTKMNVLTCLESVVHVVFAETILVAIVANVQEASELEWAKHASVIKQTCLGPAVIVDQY